MEMNIRQLIDRALTAKDNFDNDRTIDGYPREKHVRELYRAREELAEFCIKNKHQIHVGKP